VPQGFPEGLTTRGAQLADLTEIAALVRAAETADHGEPDLTLEDLASDWLSPGFDPGADAVVVLDRERIVAYAEVPSWRAHAAVHPGDRRRGIGTALLGWIEHRARQRSPGAAATVGQTVADTNVAAVTLLQRHGYTPRHTSWVLRLPAGVTVKQPPLPAGITIRPYRAAEEEEPVYRVIEDAFSEWPNRTPATFPQWQALTTGRRDFDPSLLLVAAAEDEVVGAALGLPYPDEGWVQQLAVRADLRGRGIGRALLSRMFDEFRHRGFPDVGLSTDSRTGALDLYLAVGMEIHRAYTHYSRVLSPAEDAAGLRPS
jgi:mycothiol synthase